jgi:hypothetical protein
MTDNDRSARWSVRLWRGAGWWVAAPECGGYDDCQARGCRSQYVGWGEENRLRALDEARALARMDYIESGGAS